MVKSDNLVDPKEEIKQEGKCELTKEDYFRMKVASIASELQSISQELDADYTLCNQLSAFNPSVLNYWVNLQGYVGILNKITQDVSLIQKRNSFY